MKLLKSTLAGLDSIDSYLFFHFGKGIHATRYTHIFHLHEGLRAPENSNIN